VIHFKISDIKFGFLFFKNTLPIWESKITKQMKPWITKNVAMRAINFRISFAFIGIEVIAKKLNISSK
jgi:hypothetical protein